jgi:hypothetical protein
LTHQNKYPFPVGLDNNGVPICPNGLKMLYGGYIVKEEATLSGAVPALLYAPALS